MRCQQSVLLVAFLLVATSTIQAHDLWLIPPDKAVAKQPVIVHANVGMEFPNSELAPDTAGYPSKLVIKPNGDSDPVKSAGKKDRSGLLEFTPSVSGIHLVAVTTTPKVLELDADRFNEYLVTDGMPHIFRLRVKEKSLNQAAKERYRKSPTALIRVGDSNDGKWDRVLDLPLQIVPLQNPFERKAGDTPRGAVRTDDKGEALIPINGSGLMTIRLTHMTRPKTAEYEWESFWTTLTFRVP